MRISDWSSDVCSSDLAQAGYAPGERVVDVGCGGGWTTRQIAAAVGDSGLALGLDISPDLVAAANDRAQRAGLAQIRFEQGDAATGMPVEDPFNRQLGSATGRARVCQYV